MATKSRLRGASLASLATNIDGAVVALGHVADHMPCVDAERVLLATMVELDRFKPELEVLHSEIGRDAKVASWSLDRGWHPAAFAVATHRPRVLLTIGSNALREIASLYDDVLEEPWPDTVEATLDAHRSRISHMEADLVDLRRANHCT